MTHWHNLFFWVGGLCQSCIFGIYLLIKAQRDVYLKSIFFNEAGISESGCASIFRQGKCLIWWTPWIDLFTVGCIQGVHKIRCFPSLKTEAETVSETSCFIKQLGDRRGQKKGQKFPALYRTRWGGGSLSPYRVFTSRSYSRAR